MGKLTRFFGYHSNLDYRIRTSYIVNGFAMMLAVLFVFIYGFYARYYAAVPGIVLYFGSTVLVFWLLKFGYYKLGRILILMGFILQESSIVFVLFPDEIHFNLFFFIVAPITFFILDYENRTERALSVVFSSLAVILFTASEIMPREAAVFQPTPDIVLLFNSISAFSAMLSISVVFLFFSREISRAHRELMHLANTDALTRIYNRRMFFEMGEYQFELAAKYSRKLSVILLDVDFFKNVNDHYGHLTGDKALVEIADVIRGILRKGDVFSRYGGEEFALLLKDVDVEESVAVAEKIRKSVEEHRFTTNEGAAFSITVSLGISCFDTGYKRFDQLVLAADRNLYKAKETGRNRCNAGEW